MEPDGCLFDEASVSDAVVTTNNGLLSSPRYQPFTLTDNRNNLLFPNAVIVRAGQSNSSWPEILRKDNLGNIQEYGPLNFDAYAQMMIAFYQDATLTLPMDRQYLELANELWVNGFSEQQSIDLHVTLANALHTKFPELNVGGPTQAFPRYNRNNFSNWGLAERFIQDAGFAVDFYSLHFYDFAERLSDGIGGATEFESPTDVTRVAAALDLLEGAMLNELGQVKPVVISEYGMLNRGETQSPVIFPEALQQWYVIRSVKDKMMAYMNRPDRIAVATPFIGATATFAFDGVDPALWPGIQNHVMFKGLGNQHYQTFIPLIYELLRDVQGQYIGVDSDSPNVQAQAFRDGNEIHLVLNNLTRSEFPVFVAQALRPENSVQSAFIKRLRFENGVPTFRRRSRHYRQLGVYRFSKRGNSCVNSYAFWPGCL